MAAPAEAQNCVYHAEGARGDWVECPPNQHQQQSEAATSYVALAISAEGRTASGHHWNSRLGADRQALQACTNAGGHQCKVIAEGEETCMALAVSVPDHVFALSKPIGAGWAVRADALKQCRNNGGRSCSVAISACSDGTDGGHTDSRTIIMGRPGATAP
jgi:hypothetical protein